MVGIGKSFTARNTSSMSWCCARQVIARAGEDQDAQRGIGRLCVDQLAHLAEHRGVHRVSHFGPRQREHADALAVPGARRRLQPEELIAHAQ
jgi:hypothetical protein